jgi:hypothetical protein
LRGSLCTGVTGVPWYRVVLLGLAAAAAFAVSTLLVVRELSTPTRNAAETKSERAPARPETAAAPGRDAAPGGASTRIQDRVPVGIAPSVPKTVEPPRAPAARLELTTAQIDRVRYVLLSHNVMQVEAPARAVRHRAGVPALFLCNRQGSNRDRPQRQPAHQLAHLAVKRDGRAHVRPCRSLAQYSSRFLISRS